MEREMKDSGIEWIGQIPKHWRISKVKYFVDCLDGQRVPVDTALRKSGPYPYWGAGNIVDYVDDYIFDEELILLGEDGAPFFDYTRPVAFLVKEKVWVNNHIHVLRPKNEKIDSHFLVHWLNNVDYKSYINGSILNKLTQSNMNAIAFALPPLEEQKCIADFLDARCLELNDLLDRTKTSISEYGVLKQAIIYDFLNVLEMEVNINEKDFNNFNSFLNFANNFNYEKSSMGEFYENFNVKIVLGNLWFNVFNFEDYADSFI